MPTHKPNCKCLECNKYVANSASASLHPDPDEPLMVEVPLDPEYLTPDGQYIAGYHWGKHVRSPQEFETAGWHRGDYIDRFPEFVQGVKDGYGDAMRRIEGEIAAKRELEKQAKAQQATEAAEIHRRTAAEIAEYRKRDAGLVDGVPPPQMRGLDPREAEEHIIRLGDMWAQGSIDAAQFNDECAYVRQQSDLYNANLKRWKLERKRQAKFTRWDYDLDGDISF